jgi:fatty acid amide hydrolase 2
VTAPLTERSAVSLASAIRAGETTSREIVEAHIAVLRRAQERIGAIAFERFADARREAADADERVRGAADGERLPPLLGVPCTIKESIAVAGMPNAAGLVARREHRAQRTAPAAQRLLDAGAVLLGMTNTSELTMWIETNNRLYGRTRNPYDPRRTAGGSSGGEGAAVGCGGSPVGLGSDIGGSVRLPAFFNGVFGHKPSPGLIPNSGQFPVAHGDARRLLTIGPLTRRAEDLMPVLRLVAGPDGEDDLARDVTLGDPAHVSLRGLEVIVSDDASWLPVRGELRDARERAAGALAHAGAKVRTESLRSLRRALELYIFSLQAGAGVTMAEILEQEGVEPVRLRHVLRRDTPHTIPLLLLLVSERIGARMPERRVRRAVDAGRALAREVEAVLGDGVLLHPPHPRVAPRHGRTVGRPWVLTPTAVFNLLGLPVTQVPMGLNGDGIPVGVQVAAVPDNDHVTIAVAQELERTFGGWRPPPGG